MSGVLFKGVCGSELVLAGRRALRDVAGLVWVRWRGLRKRSWWDWDGREG
jgi:hypothetical protein